MNVMETKSLADDNDYITWYDCCVKGEIGIFILHMQGGRKLIPMVKYLRSLDVPIFFCEGKVDVWINHREEIEPGLFKFKWNNTKVI